MNVYQELVVPPMSAKAFSVSSGQTVRIVDAQGKQPGDFVAFKSIDLAARLSQPRTRVENHKVAVTQGDNLWTNTFPPEVMFAIVGDTHGAHDLLYPPCCRYALEKRFGLSRDGCLENLVRALKAWSVKPHEIPDPLNLFFHVSVDEAGGMEARPPTSEPGSSIDLRAEMDCIVAVATCSVRFPATENSE
ncbi:MAG: urea carboxylase-associated family protein, partial [Planctomycetes bacterium]|nr:urea carboxylase-associated family protein [Planctomycetota bacterium]